MPPIQMLRTPVARAVQRAGPGQARRYLESGFISTRDSTGATETGSFLTTVRVGLAPDGGLYVPKGGPPTLTAAEWAALIPLGYQERAVSLLRRWIPAAEVADAELASMISSAYDGFDRCGGAAEQVTPVRHLEGQQYLLELFRGPTASFKDAALQLTPRLFAAATAGGDTSFLVLCATSGDTGSAALDGFGKVGVPVMVLYPVGGVSDIQKAQMAAMDPASTHVVAVNADFDFCQTAVKTIFNDGAFAAKLSERNVGLSAANSMNWGRLLPQVVYHASAYLDTVASGAVKLGDPVDVTVPCGNFGNILAAVYAQQMGLPFRKFVVAANENNVLSDFVDTGVYDLRKRSLSLTSSPSIDILTSSNLERMLYTLADGDSAEVAGYFESLATDRHFEVSDSVNERLTELMVGGWCSEEQCQATIKDVFERTGYILDPHTAVAKFVADKHTDEAVPMIISSTAHYGKFGDDVLRALDPSNAERLLAGELKEPVDLLRHLGTLSADSPPVHSSLVEVATAEPKHKEVVDADLGLIKASLEAFLTRAGL